MSDELARPGARSHLSPDQVGDLLEGLLPSAEAAAAAAHLSDCAQCAAVRDQVDAMPALLASVRIDGPVAPMPADVSDRLDRAIAEAARDRAEEPAGQSRAADVVPLARVRRTRQVLTGLVAAAAAVTGFVVIGDVVGDGSGEHTADMSGAAGQSGDRDSTLAGEGEPGAPERSGALASLSLRTFDRDAAALLGSLGARANAMNPSDAAPPAPACRPADLRSAEVAGTDGPAVLLEGRPVTLVTSGPRDARLVVAYSCAGGDPVAQARAVVDLTG